MAAPDPYASLFTAADWKEIVKSFHPGGGDSFSQKGGEAALLGHCAAIKSRPALRFFLGYQTISAAAPYTLLRTNPIQHPLYEHLYCTAATSEPFIPKAAELKTSRGGGGANRGIDYYANYKKTRLSLRFQPLAYTVADDVTIGGGTGEWTRNTWIDTEPRVEVLNLEGFTLKFAEGENCIDPPVSNPKGQEYLAPFGQLLAKPDIKITWDLVPSDFLIEASSGLPRNIVAGLGKVNRTAWYGYPAQTLLLMGARLVRYPWPLAAGTESKWGYTVELLASYFNPTKGGTGSAALQILTNLGHNNLPWRGKTGTALVAGDTNTGKWFFATRTGDISDAALLELFEYSQLFACVKNTLVP